MKLLLPAYSFNVILVQSILVFYPTYLNICINMGDNATKSWEWHNTEVGKGFQTRGVIRQPQANNASISKIVDMRGPMNDDSQPTQASTIKRKQSTESSDSDNPSRSSTDSSDDDSDHSSKKKSYKKKRSKSKSKSKSKSNSKHKSKSEKESKKSTKKNKKESKKAKVISETPASRFNPLLQLLASRLSDRTQSFDVDE